MSVIGDRIALVRAALARGLPSVGDSARLVSGDGTKFLAGDGAFKTGGGQAGPFPFFGTHGTSVPWSRPSLATFSTWLNQGGESFGVGSDPPFYDDGVPITAGLLYATSDTITLAGGTLAPGGVRTVLTVDTVDGGGGITGAHISTIGHYTAPPANPASQLSTSGTGAGATWGLGYVTNATATDNAGGLPLVIQSDNSADQSVIHADLSGVLKSAPNTPYTITVALAGVAIRGGSSPWFIPIILYNSAQDKAIALVWYCNSGTAAAWVYHYDGTCSFNNPVEASSGGPPSTRGGFAFPDYFAWFRVQNDGATITLSVSAEGVLFFPFYTEAANGFAPSYDKVGFGLERAFSGSGVSSLFASILWAWVETSP